MSVFIKGINKKPRYCLWVDKDNLHKCIFLDDQLDCIVQNDDHNCSLTTQYNKCPLVEIKQNMRLIDAEPIMKFIEDGLNSGKFGHDAVEIMTEIAYAPIIGE